MTINQRGTLLTEPKRAPSFGTTAIFIQGLDASGEALGSYVLWINTPDDGTTASYDVPLSMGVQVSDSEHRVTSFTRTDVLDLIEEFGVVSYQPTEFQ